MTKEEAWRRAKGCLYDALNGEEADEIIKALEQEPYDDAIKYFNIINELSETLGVSYDFIDEKVREIVMALKTLPKEPCNMTAEEYRQRMIQAFHNADCGELIALVVLPTEKEFEHLEWLLEKHYKAKPEPKTGHWIPVEYPTGVEAFGIKEMTAVALKCSECGEEVDISDGDFKLCPYCGAKMEVEE